MIQQVIALSLTSRMCFLYVLVDTVLCTTIPHEMVPDLVTRTQHVEVVSMR
jgi:hypothetical protein